MSQQTSTTGYNIYKYIDNSKQMIENDISGGCSNIVDNDSLVKTLGFSTCKNAYSEYLSRNLDINNKYGNKYSLAEICPNTTFSNKLPVCYQKKINDYQELTTMVGNISADVDNILNKRLDERNKSLSSLETIEQHKTRDNHIADFLAYDAANSYLQERIPNPQLHNIDKYFQVKFMSEGFQDIPQQQNKNLETLDVYQLKKYLGNYHILQGQHQFLSDNTMLVVDNVAIRLYYSGQLIISYFFDKVKTIPNNLGSRLSSLISLHLYRSETTQFSNSVRVANIYNFLSQKGLQTPAIVYLFLNSNNELILSNFYNDTILIARKLVV